MTAALGEFLDLISSSAAPLQLRYPRLFLVPKRGPLCCRRSCLNIDLDQGRSQFSLTD
ncbi:MAG: hypothetical protein ACK55Z_16570 [bacterium]